MPGGSRTTPPPGPRWRPITGLRQAGGRAARRLRSHAPSLLLAAGAAGTAYLMASLLVGSANAVFAPVAAVVSVGLSAGQRVLRAMEISTGVVLGILAADLLARLIGIGPLLIALAVLLAMGAAVALRPSGLMANQAAVAAVVVVALVPYLEGGPWVRLVDAVIGGVVAVVLNAIVSPDPLGAGRRVVAGVLSDYATVLVRLRDAVQHGSLEDAESALADFSHLDGAEDEVRDSLLAVRTLLFLPRTQQRRREGSVQSLARFAERVAVLVSTGRSLARATANVVRHDVESLVDESCYQRATADRTSLLAAFEHLIAGIEALQALALSDDVTSEEDAETARKQALLAAVQASSERPASQAIAVLVGQLRSAAVDVLRISGLDQPTAVAILEAEAGRADDPLR